MTFVAISRAPLTPENTVGRKLYEIGTGQWDIPELRALLETIISDRKTIEAFEVEHVFPSIGQRIMVLNARMVYQPGCEILDRLDGHDLLVSQAAAHFDISLQAISRHIQVLVRAGLVSQERTGRISRCRFDAGPIYGAAVWLNRYSKYWQAQFDLLAVSLEEIERENSTRARKPSQGKRARSTPARGRKQAAKPRLEK